MAVTCREVQPRVGDVEVEVLLDSRAQQGISTFILVTIVVLDVGIKLIIAWSADAFVITQLDASFVLLPADGKIRKQVVVSAARLRLILSERIVVGGDGLIS